MAIKKNTKKNPIVDPHNVEAEEAVLGSLLIDRDALIRISTFLFADDFYIDRNSWIYQAISDLYEKRIPADLVTLSDELKKRGQLEEIGGVAYLTTLMNATPTSVHAEYYAHIVEQAAGLRRLSDGAGDIARLAHSGGDLEEVHDQAEQIMFALGNRNVKNLPKKIADPMRRVLANVDKAWSSPTRITGLPTGLADLDKLTGGLQKSDMIIVAGRPGMGKTSLALGIGYHAARKLGKNVAAWTLEMSDEQYVQRLLSMETGIDTQRIRLGDIKDNEWSIFTQGSEILEQIPFWIDDTPQIGVHELKSKARRLHAEYGLDLIIIDYIQLMRGDEKSENRQQEISYVSRNVKALAKELNVPILALSQLSRQVESRHDKRPMLSDLRESGSLEQDGDIVAFIYKDDVYNPDTEFPNVAEIIVPKHRNGPTGIFSLYFKASQATYVDLEVRRQPLDYDLYKGKSNGKNGKQPQKLEDSIKAYQNGNGKNGNGKNGNGAAWVLED